MGFARPHVSVLVGVSLMGVATVLEIVGLAAPGWCSLWVGEQGDTMVGLWEFCYELPNFECEGLDKLWDVQSWIEVCRAFGLLALLVQGACLLSVLLMCLVRQLPLFFAIAAWSALSAGLLIFIQFSTFIGASEMERNSLGREFRYQYAFVLTILAFIFSLFSSVFLFIGEARNRKTSHL